MERSLCSQERGVSIVSQTLQSDSFTSSTFFHSLSIFPDKRYSDEAQLGSTCRYCRFLTPYTSSGLGEATDLGLNK